MTNIGRIYGANIYSIAKDAGISIEDFAVAMNYSLKEVRDVIEGKVILPPQELNKIAVTLGTTKEEIIDHSTSNLFPEKQHMNEIENPDNLDFILDLMDEYVECVEAL